MLTKIKAPVGRSIYLISGLGLTGHGTRGTTVEGTIWNVGSHENTVGSK